MARQMKAPVLSGPLPIRYWDTKTYVVELLNKHFPKIYDVEKGMESFNDEQLIEALDLFSENMLNTEYASRVAAEAREDLPSGPVDTVTFQRPARKEQLAISQLQASATVRIVGGTRQITDRASIALQESHMVMHCLTSSTVCGTDGTPIFRPGKNCRVAFQDLTPSIQDSFMETWNGMDNELCEAIVAELRLWHPEFDLWGFGLGNA